MDVHLERKLHYDNAKQKVKGKLRLRLMHYASITHLKSALATPVAVILWQTVDVNPFIPTLLVGNVRGRILTLTAACETVNSI